MPSCATVGEAIASAGVWCRKRPKARSQKRRYWRVEQDELVPCVVDDLRWHRHHVAAGIVAEMEVFAQAGKYLLALLECQFRPLPGEAAVKRLRVRKASMKAARSFGAHAARADSR